ncbi:MAG: energy-coupling factor transporter transmembrane protein EcfT [Muribaculaceae bacterium]|nr:energy-coupling factor transporter transmembrane protein EcfT [Muribaculaceae bacterium]
MTGTPYTAAPSMLLVTLVYLIAVLSVPIQQPATLIWLAAYPVVASEITGIGFGRVFLRSFLILPLIIFIGIFNPFLDKETAFFMGNIPVSKGWVSFISIILRGLLSFQAVILLVSNTGFINLFNSMRIIGFPKVLTTQLLLTYRYITLVAEEAIIMKRARIARGYGRSKYPLKDWGRFVGLLLIRSSNRAASVHRAMKARGFSGTLPLGSPMRWTASAWIWLTVWIVIILILRLIDFPYFVSHLLPLNI